jgi:hypothetical protein
MLEAPYDGTARKKEPRPLCPWVQVATRRGSHQRGSIYAALDGKMNL